MVKAPLTLFVALAALLLAQPAGATALTSVVTDQVGDVWFPNAPAYQDIVEASVTLRGSHFIFRMELAGVVPSSPTLPPQGGDHIVWVHDLDTDPTTNPQGFPFAPGFASFAEFFVVRSWDGMSFIAFVIDRRPLLTGMAAVVTSVPFSIKDSEVTSFVDATLLGNPSSFKWFAATVDWPTPFGTAGFQPVDHAPEAGFATWPP